MNGKTLVGGGIVLVPLLFFASTLSAAPITGLNNTGILVTGLIDQAWTVTTSLPCPAGATECTSPNAYVPTDQNTVSPVSFGGTFWNVTNPETSKWITQGTREDGTVEDIPGGAVDHLVFGVGLFTYETTFTLPEFTSASITGSWWADGQLNWSTSGFSDGAGGCGIYLNNNCVYDLLVDVPGSFTGPSGHSSADGNPFTISSGFQTGTNTLRFVVLNGGDETGLRVTHSGTFDTQIPEPATYALMGAGLAVVALMRRRTA